MIGIEGWRPRRPARRTRRPPRRAPGLPVARPGDFQAPTHYVLQNEDGQIASTHSISAGLDYPAIGPEHAWLPTHRAEYSAVSDQPLSMPRVCSHASKASFPRSNRPRHRAASSSAFPNMSKTTSSVLNLPPAATGHGHLLPPALSSSLSQKLMSGETPVRLASLNVFQLRTSGELGIVAYITAGAPHSMHAAIRSCACRSRRRRH